MATQARHPQCAVRDPGRAALFFEETIRFKCNAVVNHNTIY